MRKTKLLRRIENRVKLVVRTATGKDTTTRGKGDLVIHGCIQDGTVKKLEGIGSGHFLPELTHSLLSVSQLCSNGCTVIFKPKEAYLVTPDGDTVLFERHQGLYILPNTATGEALKVGTIAPDHRDEGCKHTVGVMKRSLGNNSKTRAKQTVGYLKQAHKLATKEYLFLMDRLKLNSAHTVGYALAMKTELSTVKRRKKQLSKLRESEDEDQSSYWNQSSKSGKRQGKSTPRKSSTARDTKHDKKSKKQQDVETRLQRKMDEAKTLLRDTESKLQAAIRDNLLERSQKQNEAADRALARAREWHRIHRKLGHPSKRTTDEAYLSKRYFTAAQARRKTYDKLPHELEKHCVTCMKGKLGRYRTKRALNQDKDVARRPGEVWHGDLCGPFPASRLGYKYICAFTEAATGYIKVYPIKRKSDTLSCLKTLRKDLRSLRVRTHADTNIHPFRQLVSDRGGEYTTNLVGNSQSDFNRWCDKRNITQRFTNSHSSWQNGKAERTNRTLVERLRCNIMDSGAPWTYWPEALSHGATCLNHTPRSNQNKHRKGKSCKSISPYTNLTGLEDNSTMLEAFGTEGQMAVVDPTKDLPSRTVHVRLLSFASDTKGYLVQADDGTLHKTEQVAFDKDLHRPWSNGYSKAEDDMARRAIEDDPTLVDLHTNEPNDHGIPVGLDDDVLRDRADQTDNTTIGYKSPLRHFSTLDGTTAGRAKPPPRGNPPMSNAEAIVELQRFVDSKGSDHPLYAHFRQDNPKKGSKHGATYEKYKSVVTVDDYLACTALGKKKQNVQAGHFIYDLKKGWVVITDSRECTAFSVVTVDMEKVVNATLAQDPLNYVIMAKEHPDIVQKYYEFSTGDNSNLETMLDDSQELLQRVIQGGDTSALHAGLVKHVHANAMIGEENTHHKSLSEYFAMAMAREIVCGKVTPGNDAEAKASPEWSSSWLPALKQEIEALKKMDAFEYVPREDMIKANHKAKPTKTVYKIKTAKSGEIDKYKCRIVVQGFSLIPNNEFYDSFSSVLGHASLRMLLYVAAQDPKEQISSADIGNAFLEADLKDPVYIEQHPEVHVEGKPHADYVLKLKKCLYGIPQAGRGYQRAYNKLMKRLGFKRLNSDDCLFIKIDPVHGRIIVGNYVDDLICVTKSTHLRDEWRAGLKARFKRVTTEDTCDYLLGAGIDTGTDTKGNHYIEMNNTLNIEKVAALMGITDEHGQVVCPMESTCSLRKKIDGEDDESSYIPGFEYARILGGIMYVANFTRPDLVTSVNKLARYVTNPSHTHFKALAKVVTYAYQTKDRRLRYTQGPKDNDCYRLWAASDSSYADCLDTRRSTIGRCLWMGKNQSGLIDWRSSMPKTVSLSTTEAEVQAAIECTKDILYFRSLLGDLGYSQEPGSTRMMVDSNSAIAQIRSVSGISRSKHYLVPLRKIQEVCMMGEMHVQRIDSKDNPADAYTKPLPAGSFWRHSTAALGDRFQPHKNVELRDRIMATEYHGGSVKAVVRDLGKTKSGKQKAAKEARKIVEMKGKQIKDELSLAMIQLFTKLLDEDSVEASTIDDVIQGPN